MHKKFFLLIAVTLFLTTAFVYVGYFKSPKFTPSIIAIVKPPEDFKNGTYTIEGEKITLQNGQMFLRTPGLMSGVTTRCLDNNAKGDVDGDGVPDIAFFLTQESSGSGVFYYFDVFLGGKEQSDATKAVLLGDRILPQSIEIIDGRIVVNYKDRLLNEPMATPPTVGVTKYFEYVDGELIEIKDRLTESEARSIAEKECIKGGKTLTPGVYMSSSKSWLFDANLNATRPGCTPVCVVGEINKNAIIDWRCEDGLKK